MAGGSSSGSKDEMSDLLGCLNLTAEEEDVFIDSDDEVEEEANATEWSLIRKVLSPKIVHSTTVFHAMKPAWGNPKGLEVRSVGEKKDNLFIADFEGKMEKKGALEGSLWMISKFTVILQDYDAKLRPSDVLFDRMSIWVRILNLPFGWINAKKGEKAARAIGLVEQIDVNDKG
ncbi:hypothetical protein C2845_PM06G28060 [Panicum miliaceum]|uniref:Uncharacterized protein n=1 Tax=Panicum miliaceum TaxID=4540 RepID=A0A3L6R6T0_PANMI|nr:hypothetical protein C2845_PM06G28060 [Panicum miliaceum]